MPQFAPGEAKTAIAPITISPAGLSCEVELFLGPDELTKLATSGRIPFTSTAVAQDISFPVTMPEVEGTYPVFLDVFVAGQLIGAYKATEDVVIVIFNMVTVSLRNPPAGAEWQLVLYDWNETDSIKSFQVGIGEAAVFNIPPEWEWPLRLDILIGNPITGEIYCRLHSTSDGFPQYHEDIFIPEPGEYYFNVATHLLDGIIEPGFVLGATNVPSNVKFWQAQISGAQSGYLESYQKWHCPVDPQGRNLVIWGVNTELETVYEPVWGVGPIYSGKNYIFDFLTKLLREV